MNTYNLKLIHTALDFDYVDTFSEGLAYVCKNGLIGFIDMTGEIVIPLGLYDNINQKTMFNMRYIFKDGLSPAVKNNKCGFINKSGEVVIPMKYDTVSSFCEGLAAAKKDNKWGFINRFGEEVIPFIYDFVQSFSEDIAVVKKDNKFGCIGKDGKTIIELNENYNHIEPFHEGVAVVITNRKDLPTLNREKNESKNDFLIRTSLEVKEKTKDEKYGIIDKTGQLVLPFEYSYLSSFYNEIAVSEKNGSTNYINKKGHILSFPKFDEYGCFYNGFAWVKKNKKCGCIDKIGKLVIPLKYDNNFIVVKEGLATVKINDCWGCVDIEGNTVIPLKYEYISTPENKTIITKKGSKWEIYTIDTAE